MDSVAGSASGVNFEGVIRFKEGGIRSHVDEVVRKRSSRRSTACWMPRQTHCAARSVTSGPRSGSTRGRGITIASCRRKAGEVTLQVPRLRNLPFETEIIERYRRRESSVEEALVEMYLAGSRCGAWRTSPRPCGARA